MEPLLHKWKMVNEDRYNAVYDCEQCGISHIVQFIGLNIETVGPCPPNYCTPRKVEKNDAKESHVR